MTSSYSPIQPATTVPTQNESTSNEDVLHRSPTELTKKQSRKNVSFACRRCQQRRIKCSGDIPCHSCAGQGYECLYSSETDARRKPLRKRKVEELQSDSDFLRELLNSIRNTDDGQVDQLVSLIRSNAPLEDLRLCIEQQAIDARLAKRERSPELESLHDYIENMQAEDLNGLRTDLRQPRDARAILKIDRLVDSPPYSVPASPWTNITSDDTIVSNLVSVWLLWDKPFFNFIDETPFLRDMRNNKTASQYCSAFLVNALLACACPYSDYDEVKCIRGAPSVMMLRFLAEAQRLLDEITNDDDELSIATVQGLVFMFEIQGVIGNDSLSRAYMTRAISIRQRLEEKYAAAERSLHSSTIEEELTFAKALDATVWGIFNYHSMAEFAFLRSTESVVPTRPIPALLSDTERWAPYPQSGPPIWAHAHEVLHQQSRLSCICRDAGFDLRIGKKAQLELHWQDIEQVVDNSYSRLVEWQMSLPQHLFPTATPSLAILLLHCFYESIIMNVFTQLRLQASRRSQMKHINNEEAQEKGTRESNEEEGGEESEEDIVHAKDQYEDKNKVDAIVQRANQMRRESAVRLVQLCRLYESAYGNTHINMSLLQPVFQALSILVEDAELMLSDYHNEVSDLCVFFRALSRRWPFTMALFRSVQLSLRNRGLKLPPDTEKLFEEFEAQEWESRELIRLMSIYPVENKRPDEIRSLSEFLNMMEDLSLQ